MAQRRRIENPVVDISNDEAFNLCFQKAAGELTKLYSLALDRQTAFDAGTRCGYMRVYEWIQLQLQDGKSVTATHLSAYLQDKLNQLDSNMLNAQQQVEIEQLPNEMLLENDMHNAHQVPEQLVNGTQSEESGDTNGNQSGELGYTNGNPPASQVQDMDINY